ncbi:MAG TPA: 3-deoxy-8-phosphooctulonate synthase [Oligoflexia bacterium]|nr:3-deoxy-8-phosphooctulonate synthase [Oligoflexia bacterium]HMP49321.1 3-deoxy-8-phosphooctulonate synthase [Oligoflexia bacterium]
MHVSNQTEIFLPDCLSSFVIGNQSCLPLILGPCVIESRESVFRHAEKIQALLKSGKSLGIIFKSSYDKANRTSGSSFRGPGLHEGLEILAEVRREFNLPVITDVHSPDEARAAGDVVDVLQIPAFLCRQTDLLMSAGSRKKPVLIKKGQFLHPSDMAFAAGKVSEAGSNQLLLCERGSSFGYRELVVDFRSFAVMRELEYPVVFDATHSVQSIGGSGKGTSSGARKYVPALSRAAISFGVDALFLECHEDPDHAPSDGPNMIPIDLMSTLVSDLSGYWEMGKKIRQEY